MASEAPAPARRGGARGSWQPHSKETNQSARHTGGQGGGRANHRRTHCATSTVKAHKTTLRDAHTQFVATNTCDKIEENIIRPLQDHGLLGEDEGRGQGAGLRGSAASVLFRFGGKRGEILMRARHTGVLLTSGTLHIKNK